MRIGLGFDIHQLTSQPQENKPAGVTLGGVIIPFDKQFIAHSDGDVVLHALTDALLGACALGDIGTHFPDTDEKFKGLDSKHFVISAYQMVKNLGFVINNVDINIIAQKPKLLTYILSIRQNIATLLNTSIDNVSVKAKTHEGLDSIGEQKAISAQVIVLLKNN